MQYSSHLLVKTYILILTATSGVCWQYFTALSDIQLYKSVADTRHVHSEYIFGHCQRKGKIFYAHVHLDHIDVLGKTIIRGWLDIYRIPTCIVMRGLAYEVDLIRSSAYPFQVCVPRISYCHTQQRTLYFFYELYVPDDVLSGVNWDLYFYGPPSRKW